MKSFSPNCSGGVDVNSTTPPTAVPPPGGFCVDAGFVGCCVSGCFVGSCFCDQICYVFGDCCDDIADIGCFPENIGNEKTF